MSEIGNSEAPKKISRRNFLKVLGIGAGAVAVGSLSTACEKVSDSLSPYEVENFSKLPPMNVSGKGEIKDIFVQYAPEDIQHLTIRLKGNSGVVKAFAEGQEVERYSGEITESRLYKVIGKNEDMKKHERPGIWGMYPNYTGPSLGGGVSDLPSLRNLFAIPVAVPVNSYYDTMPPLEKNPNYIEGRGQAVSAFCQGYMVGSFEKVGENHRFLAQGYVTDARAIKVE